MTMKGKTLRDGATSGAARSRPTGPGAMWRDRQAVRLALSGELLSLVNLVGRPVIDPAGARVGRVSDIVVRWESGIAHPPVSRVLVSVGSGLAAVAASDVTLTQSQVQMRFSRTTATEPARQDGEVFLARDVLDHQLVDVNGVQVVRAADVYLAKGASGWELAGVDVGVRALLRRVLPNAAPARLRTGPWPGVICRPSPLGSRTRRQPVRARSRRCRRPERQQHPNSLPAAALHRLRARDVAGLLAGLDRNSQAQLAGLAGTSAVAEALGDLEPAKKEALLGELDEADRAKLGGAATGGLPMTVVSRPEHSGCQARLSPQLAAQSRRQYWPSSVRV